MFIGLFTQPFDQSLKASSRWAGAAILLVIGISGLQLLFDYRFLPVKEGEFAAYSFVLVIAWILMTSILHKDEGRKLAIARNLSVLSFWIAGVLVVVLLANSLYPDPLDGALRRLVSSLILIVLISIHMFCQGCSWRALRMTASLWISTVFLVHMAL